MKKFKFIISKNKMYILERQNAMTPEESKKLTQYINSLKIQRQNAWPESDILALLTNTNLKLQKPRGV